jgi:hypothetical protein
MPSVTVLIGPSPVSGAVSPKRFLRLVYDDSISPTEIFVKTVVMIGRWVGE